MFAQSRINFSFANLRKKWKKSETKNESEQKHVFLENNKKILMATKCVTDLNLGSEMIIFEQLLTTFEVIVIFEAAGAEGQIDLSQKPYHQKQVQPSEDCPNP